KANMNVFSFASTSLLAAVFAASIFACAASAKPAPQAGSAGSTTLDGRTFVIEGNNVPAGQPSQIELVFSGASLDPAICHPQGLPPIAYRLESDGSFPAERRHGESVDVWSGRVVAESIEGTMVSQTNGATTMNIAFLGRAR